MSKRIIAFLLILLTLPAGAIAATDRELFFPFYSNAVAEVCGSDDLVGSKNEEKAYNFFVSEGFSAIHSAAIVGNFKLESGVNPKSTNKKSGAHGIAQWLGGRLDRLKEFANQQGKDRDSLELQLDFVIHELGGLEKRAKEKLLETTNVTDAAVSWENHYERAGGAGMAKRIRYAKAILAKYGSNADPDANVSDSVVCDGSGELVGDFSLPVDRKWYEKDKGSFNKPHWNNSPAIDISLPNGEPIYSMTAGKVTNAPNGGNCGRGVTIDAGSGVSFIYCHGSDGGSVSGAKEGDTVEAGQLIMHSDNTGRTSGPHLHLGIRVGGQSRCPQSLLIGIAEGSPPDVLSLPSSGCTRG